MSIVVTGASRGIGKAIAMHLHEQGDDVVGVARTVSGDLPFQMISCDVSDPATINYLSRTIKRGGVKLEGLINVAGIAAMNLALTTPASVSSQVIRVNLLGTIFPCQALLPLIIRAGGGFVINFSSIAVHLGLAGESSYVASKAGVEAYSRVLAREVAGFGIRVNCIAPGPVETDLLRGVSERQKKDIVDRQIIKRQFSTEDICALVDMLRSEASRSITGQVLHVGGV